MKNINFDFWYNNTFSDIAFVTVSFYPGCEKCYRGNIFDINRKCIGDYSTSDSVALGKMFPGLFED